MLPGLLSPVGKREEAFCCRSLQISLIVLAAVAASAKDQEAVSSRDVYCHPCGPWRAGGRGGGVNRRGRAQQRIVGGEEVKSDRPWMAYVEIHANVRFHCGGSVINRRFVLTAAHCTCDALPCVVNDRDELVLNYNPEDKIFVYVGFKDVEKKKDDPENVYKVIEAKVHEKYRQDFHDLALLKTDREIAFSSRVRPICISRSPSMPDNRGRGHVAGWGHVKNRACHSGPHGPSPFTQCAFPFVWRNRTFSTCAKSETPSTADPVCLAYSKLEAASGGAKLLTMKDTRMDMLDQKNGNRLTTCFTTNPGDEGWCATCRLGASKGQPNFCSSAAAANKSPAAKGGQPPAVPKFDADWGVCKHSCAPGSKSVTNVLQEVVLTILDIGNCSEILKKSNSTYNLDMELCAGKINRRTVRRMGVDLSDDGRTVKGFAKRKDDVKTEMFIGGQDSCLGDSGGPLWKIYGSRAPLAFLVGVVSRGLNCANNDAPGIYARVKMYTKWIFSNAREGDCQEQRVPAKKDSQEEKAATGRRRASAEDGLSLLRPKLEGNTLGVLKLLKKRREKERKKQVIKQHIGKILQTVASREDYGKALASSDEAVDSDYEDEDSDSNESPVFKPGGKSPEEARMPKQGGRRVVRSKDSEESQSQPQDSLA